jgi:DNA-binding IclR family transcriptional regulator
VSRPALSASRSIEIMELLATFPDRDFSLSEIVKATTINVSSCYAILAALTEKGYLIKAPRDKTYRLGSSLIALGHAAQRSQPIVELATEAASGLLDEFGLPVLLSTVVGDELLALVSLEDGAGRTAGMFVGERLPLVAPIGTPFLAWAPDEAVEEWIARRNSPLSSTQIEALRRDLELTRERGYQVALRPTEQHTIGALMAEMAKGGPITDYKDEIRKLIHTFDTQMFQPVTFEDDENYDVLLIAAPIFDQGGNATFNLCLGGFPGHLSGAKLQEYAKRLSTTCLDVMRASTGRRAA